MFEFTAAQHADGERTRSASQDDPDEQEEHHGQSPITGLQPVPVGAILGRSAAAKVVEVDVLGHDPESA